MDYGREWYLTLYMQHLLRNHRFCETDRSLAIKKPPPFLQTSSKKVSYILTSLSSLNVCIVVVDNANKKQVYCTYRIWFNQPSLTYTSSYVRHVLRWLLNTDVSRLLITDVSDVTVICYCLRFRLFPQKAYTVQAM